MKRLTEEERQAYAALAHAARRLQELRRRAADERKRKTRTADVKIPAGYGISK